MATNKRKPPKNALGTKSYILYLDAKDHHKLKLQAVKIGVSMKQYINDLIKAALASLPPNDGKDDA
jgi:predicted HicB family RNase H-like nuclease